MTTGQPKWFARSPAALEDYQRQRLAQYPTAKVILPCATCSSQTGLTAPAQAGPSARHQIAHVSADQAAQIRAALWQVISESEPAASCHPAQLASLLADLLPDQPGIRKMLVTAAEERVTDLLRDHASAGLDGATAIKLVASTFATRTRYDPDTCAWLFGELAATLGLFSQTGYTPTAPATTRAETRPVAHPADPPAQPEDRDDHRARATLEVLKARGHAPSLQAIYDGLHELGYIPHPPAARQTGNENNRYLRWTDPARGGPAVIYLEKADLWFVRKEDLTTLGDLPSGTTTLGGRQHNAQFPVNSRTTDQILVGAKRLKR